MEILLDTLKSKVVTDNPELLKALYEYFSFKKPGSEYSPAYRRGHWDGKAHFISRKGVFRTGMLHKVEEALAKIECTPEIKDNRVFNTATGPWELEGTTLYDYQDELVKTALDLKRGIIKSPTGSGKTIILASLIKALEGRKMVVLFTSKQILKQTYEFLTTVAKFESIGFCCGEGFIDGDIMLSTVQSIERILDTHLETAEVLFVDEVQEFANGETTVAAIQSFPKADYRFGMTATVPKDPVPSHNLAGAFGPVINVRNTSDLVEEGKLTKPIIQLIERTYDASGKDEDMSFPEVYDEYIVHNDSRNGIIKTIVDSIRENNERPRVLILTKSLAHGRTLEKLLGDDCEFLEGINSLAERYESIHRFTATDGPRILIGTKILQTGVNIQEVTHFINARGMKSEIATIQALGRALRKHESKEVVYVYDFMDKEKYLEGHSIQRRRHYKREGHEVHKL